jgi:rubrerythrin
MSGAKDENGRVTQLQWQEGTDEPEDEPNISNGVDTMPKKPPTRQPWEQPILPGRSFQAAPKKEEIDHLYNEGLRRWLAYEQASIDLYSKLEDKDGWYAELIDEAKKEVATIKDGLSIK